MADRIERGPVSATSNLIARLRDVTPTQKTRMFKCMSLLVVSMSVGALVLSMGEPGPVRAADVASVRRAAAAAIGWVDADPALRAEAWSAIRVRHERPPAGASGALLTAISRPDTDHFTISADAGLTIGPAWHETRASGTPDGTIRIRVELQRPETAPTPAQRAVLDDLLSVLITRCGLDRHAVTADPPAHTAARGATGPLGS